MFLLNYCKGKKHPIGRIMREYAWIWRLQYLVLQGLVMMCNLRESLIHVISLCLCVSNRIHLLLLAFKESVVKVGSGWHRCFWLRIRLLTPWVLQWKHARSVVSLLFGLEATIFYDFERYPLGGCTCGALSIFTSCTCGGLKQPAVRLEVVGNAVAEFMFRIWMS